MPRPPLWMELNTAERATSSVAIQQFDVVRSTACNASFPRSWRCWILQNGQRRRSLCSNLMSSALLSAMPPFRGADGAEYCRTGNVVGRYAAIWCCPLYYVQCRLSAELTGLNIAERATSSVAMQQLHVVRSSTCSAAFPRSWRGWILQKGQRRRSLYSNLVSSALVRAMPPFRGADGAEYCRRGNVVGRYAAIWCRPLY